ncbi:MAG TPA: acyl-CoA dehydrogenase family protein [Mycobacteriales bacterium]|jgi:alkylation response protein AidB-like acyl-CoA dehydrogenase|nr:acyl-CoA dehydrogenase family protein [Mycobacteriales bacterium]
MNLDFTPEQDLLRDSVRRACERHSGLDVVRKLENDPVGYSPELWQQLSELGVTGLVIDEQYGGSGMTMVDAAVVYEEFGRAIVPSPHFVSAVLAAGLIGRSANEELKGQILPGIASGETIVTVASLEPDNGFSPAGIQLTATKSGDGWTLSGAKRHVPFAQAAASMIVLARAEGGRGGSGVIALLVDASTPGITLTQQLTVASDAQFRVDFDNVTARAVVHEPGAAWEAWHDTMLDGAALLAAQAAGGARAALDLARDYANTREQFDKPLAAFQAISHYLADSVTAVDGAQTLAWEAAWARSEGRSVETLAPMAKSYACQTFRKVSATAVQIFGGNGFTVEFDIQLYFRRAKSMQINNWDERYCNELVAAQLLDA